MVFEQEEVSTRGHKSAPLPEEENSFQEARGLVAFVESQEGTVHFRQPWGVVQTFCCAQPL